MMGVTRRWLLACLLMLASGAILAQEEVKLGILAYRPKAQVQAQWKPLGEALNRAFPGNRFVVEILNFQEMSSYVASRQVDFILTNPGHFVLMASRSGLSAPLATLSSIEQGAPVTSFGGVIFTRADRSDIRKLQDVRGKSVAVTSSDSLGGAQMQSYEFLQAGIQLPQDVRLISTGLPHDNVVDAVLNGSADVGLVRSGVLESLADEGKLDLAKIAVVNQQDLPGFPVRVSTRLYPEWIFAAMPHNDKDLNRRVVSFLLNIEANKELTRALHIHGFDVPSDYSGIVAMLRELRMPPFDVAPSFSARDVWGRYRWQVLTGLFAAALLLLLGARLLLVNRHLKAERRTVHRQTQSLIESELRFRHLTEMSSDFFWESDAEHRLTQRTESKREAAELVFRQTPSIGKRRWEIPALLPDEAGWQKHRELLDAHVPFRDFEILRIRANGAEHHICVSGDPVFSACGDFTGYRGVGTDITERKLAEAELRIAATSFDAREGMMIADADGVILRVNQAFTKISGYSAAQIVGQTPRMFRSDRHDAGFFHAMWESINQSGGWQGEIWNRRENGEVRPQWLTITAVKSDDGTVTHYVGTHTDITARKAADDEIERLAFYDPLTDLPNRRLMLDRLGQALTSSARHDWRGALMLIDLDNFKSLNDTLGHAVGDQLLVEVAARLKSNIRDGDTAARLGGDEFVVILEDLDEDDLAAVQAQAVATTLLAELGKPYRLDVAGEGTGPGEHRHHCSASIGITLFRGHSVTRDELMKRTDTAMYQAKAAGRATLRFFDPQMQEAVKARAVLELDLRKAIVEGQFVLHYQAQVDASGRVIGAEALVRWRHPERGLVSPAEFIPLAEETGLILPLGHWVMQTACARLAAWSAQPDMAQLTLAVNVSARQFSLPNLVEEVLALVRQSGARADKLKLELTESVLMENADSIIAKMMELKTWGVGFSLDDFGTGYSSLSYLRRLPLDQLKIDQSFIRDILTNPNDAAIARTVVALAQSLGLAVIAEGVETQGQRDFLASNGCLVYQGYFFSRPLPLEEFEELVKRA